MKVIYSVGNDSQCSCALGYFDGVHLGHAAVIGQAVSYAKQKGIKSAVFSFFFDKDRLSAKGQEDIFTTKQRIERFERLGVDLVFMLPFSRFCHLTDSQFVKDIIKDGFNCSAVFSGEDYSFGKGGTGKSDRLVELCALQGIEAFICPQLSEGGQKISSSRIRALISKGDMEKASRLLGGDYSFTAPIEKGDTRGRTLGFATANQTIPEGMLCPEFGVYVSEAEVKGQTYRAVTNIGVRPTFYSKGIRLAETHIIGFSGDIYGVDVKLTLLSFLRPEQKFGNVNELIAQLEKDRTAAENYDKKGI